MGIDNLHHIPVQIPMPPPQKFDKNANLPENLQERIDAWHDRPPPTQFRHYGALNNWFIFKAGVENFITKPQKRFSDGIDVQDGLYMPHPDSDTDDEDLSGKLSQPSQLFNGL